MPEDRLLRKPAKTLIADERRSPSRSSSGIIEPYGNKGIIIEPPMGKLEMVPMSSSFSKALGRIRETFAKDVGIHRSLIYSMGRGTPTAFPQTMAKYMEFLTEPYGMHVFVRIGGQFRGFMSIQKTDGIPNIGALREEFPAADMFINSAIKGNQVILKTRKGKVISASREDEHAISIGHVNVAEGENALLVMPFGYGVAVAWGRDLTFGGWFSPARITVETTASFSKELEDNREARVDQATGLLNRREYLRIMDYAVGAFLLTGENFSLALSDIDHFGDFNKESGIQAGDHVISEVSKTLMQEAIRYSDLVTQGRRGNGSGSNDIGREPKVARHGGDEMIVIFIGADEFGGAVGADRFGQMLEGKEMYDYDCKRLRSVTASSGVTSVRAAHEALMHGIVLPPVSQDNAVGGVPTKPYPLMDFEEMKRTLMTMTLVLAGKALKVAKLQRISVVSLTVQEEEGTGRRYRMFTKYVEGRHEPMVVPEI